MKIVRQSGQEDSANCSVAGPFSSDFRFKRGHQFTQCGLKNAGSESDFDKVDVIFDPAITEVERSTADEVETDCSQWNGLSPEPQNDVAQTLMVPRNTALSRSDHVRFGRSGMTLLS